MKKLFHKANQAGTMLVEAMAMLGLIAMVTPILYKKAAERTTELQDINASNQLRVLSTAMDAYIKDNFARITRGEKITNSCSGADTVDYNSLANAVSGTVSMSLAHLCEYLPYGFLDSNGHVQDTKMFTAGNDDSFRVIIKMEGNDTDDNKTITGFLTAIPHNANTFSSTRASRIATMVGSNGGYIDHEGKAMGAQGIWSLDNPSDELNGVNLPQNSFVVASIQPISSQGLANEDVLHRKSEPDNDDILNTMETDLYMGFADEPNNIRLVNQIIMLPKESRMVMADDETDTKGVPESSKYSDGYKPELKNALYIGNGGGTYIEGALAAMDSLFTIDEEGIGYYDANPETTDPTTGSVSEASRGDKVFGVTTETLEYGNIAGKDGAGSTAANLLSVSTNTFKYGAPAYSTSTGDGTPPTSNGEQELIYADREKVNLGNRALQVTSENGEISASSQWSSKTDPWKVVVGEGKAHNEAYTEYAYDGSGNAGEGAEVAARDYALTINGPAFIKDTLRTGKLRSRDIDAAKLRAGADPDTYNTAVNDQDFYGVIEHEQMLVGRNGTDDTSTYRLQIAENEDTTNNIAAGIGMRHEKGIAMFAGEKLTGVHFNADGLSGFSDKPEDHNIIIGAEDGISLGTLDETGQPTGGTVSIQNNMLQAYHNDARENILDSVIKEYNIVDTDNDLPSAGEVSYYNRDETNGNVRLGGVNMSIQNLDEDRGRPVFDVSPDLLDNENEVVSKMTGSMAIYDRDYDHYDTTEKSDRRGNVLPQGYASVYVNKGDFSILATEDKDSEDIRKGDVIFQVDNNAENINVSSVPEEDRRGSLYVRRGALSVATDTNVDILSGEGDNAGMKSRITHNTISNNYVDPAQAVGYISADRFVANVQPLDGSLDIGSRTDHYKNLVADSNAYYDKFEVNPAYTSVMHDIKLTTRGGARLSDILPDFINKGIYVVDNTYNPNLKWSNNGFDPRGISEWNSSGSNGRIETSAFLGLVPTPQCPPQYVKVVTLTPASWAMAQAGTPAPEFKTLGSIGDILTHNDPYQYYYTDSSHTMLRENSQEKSSPRPLTFQKSTWLKGMVVPACPTLKYDGSCNGNKNFIGWGAVLGFIYPHNYYKDFIQGASGASGYATILEDDDNNKVYWNLYPVYKKELEAYATVYCYFARKGKDDSGTFEIYDENYVDVDYDQLNNPRSYYDKGNTEYKRRLNDPALKYTDPW